MKAYLLSFLKQFRWHLVGFFAALVLVYSFITAVDPNATDINLIHRRIETPAKLWLNGYFGHFFNFKYLGNITWLLLVLLPLAFIRYRLFNQAWHKAVLFAYLLSLALVCVKGYFNARYQITLVPLSFVLLALTVQAWLQRNQLLKYLPLVWLFFMGILASNNVFALLFMKNLSVTSVLKINRESKLDQFKKSLKTNYEAFKNFEIRAKEPAHVIAFLRKLKNEKGQEKIMVNNLPMVYYYTDLKAAYYWAGDDDIFGENGKTPLMRNRSFEEVKHFLRDSLNCNYMLSMPSYNKYDSTFNAFTLSYFKPVYLDISEFAVYQLMDSAGYYPIDSLAAKLSRKISQYQLPYFVTELDE